MTSNSRHVQARARGGRGSRRRGTRRGGWSRREDRCGRRLARGGGRAASRRGAGRRCRPRAAWRSPRAARDQAVQAVGAVQGSSPPCQLSDGTRPKRLSRWATRRSRVRRAAGKRAGSEKGRTAHAAAESRPESGSAATRTRPRGVPNSAATQAPSRRWADLGRYGPPSARCRMWMRSRWRESRQGRPPDSRSGRARQGRAHPVPWVSRVAARFQPLVPPPRPSPARRPARLARRRARRSPWNRAAVPQVQVEQEARDSPRLWSVAGGGEGDSDRRGVARPDVGPAVPRSGGDRAGPPVGQRPQHQQRAPVHRPCPARGLGAQRPGARQPAPIGAGCAGPADPSQDHDPLRPEPRHGAQHVGPGQVSLPDRVGAPERQASSRLAAALGRRPLRPPPPFPPPADPPPPRSTAARQARVPAGRRCCRRRRPPRSARRCRPPPCPGRAAGGRAAPSASTGRPGARPTAPRPRRRPRQARFLHEPRPRANPSSPVAPRSLAFPLRGYRHASATAR